MAALVCQCACNRPTEASSKQLRSGSTEVEFKAADGGKAFGDLYKGPAGTKAVILMFHQAGASSAEYVDIAPRVAKLGFDCLAIDQRSGGVMFGALNRALKEHPGPQTYQTAYLDIEGAYNWAGAEHYQTIIAWGSSYSASLALRLAAEKADIKAVMSFSPGEYFDQKGLVAGWASGVKVPTLMAFTQEEAQDGTSLFSALPSSTKNVMASFPMGKHGSSTLKSRDGEQYWTAVEAFLKPFAKT